MEGDIAGRLLSFCLLLLVLACHAHAEVTAGHVVDADSGNPLPGVTVKLLNILLAPMDVVEQTTDANGAFSFDTSVHSTSAAHLTAALSGYISSSYLQVDSFADRQAIELRLQRAGSMSVLVVTAEDGTPLASERVEASAGALKYAYTDSDGRALFSGLAPGDYRLCTTTQPTEYLNLCHDGTRLGLGSALTGDTFRLEGGQHLEFTLALPVGGAISGLLLDADTGAELDGVQVAECMIWSADGTRYTGRRCLVDSAASTYRLAGLPEGAYRIAARPFPVGTSIEKHFALQLYPGLRCDTECPLAEATAVPVSLGETTSAIDFAFESQSAIEGRVVADGTGEPLAGAEVVAYRYNAFPPSWSAIAEAATDAQGQYALTHLPSDTDLHIGTRNSHARINEGWPDVACGIDDCYNGDPVRLVEHEVRSGIDFQLASGAGIGGTVRSSWGNRALLSEVTVYASNGTPAWAGSSAVDGSYMTPALPPGRYVMRARTTAAPFDCVMYPSGACLADGSPSFSSALAINVDTATVTGIDVVLDGPIVFADGFD